MPIKETGAGIKLPQSVSRETVLLHQVVRPDRASQGIFIVTQKQIKNLLLYKKVFVFKLTCCCQTF